MTRASAFALVIAGVIAGGAAGCGEDDEGGGGGADNAAANADAKKKAADAKKKAADAKKKAKKSGKPVEVSYIPTLERTVPAEEAPTIRRRLKDRDFALDPTGTENRDPFRSYVLPQVATETIGTSTPMVSPTDLCSKNKLVATSYAMRDLALIGIVVRGPQRFALFRDAKGVGHMVDRGKCLGREKALVTEIGDGHVTVEIVPEPVPNAPPPVPEKRSIPLYANELTVEDLDETEDTAAPQPGADPLQPAPPPAGPTSPTQ